MFNRSVGWFRDVTRFCMRSALSAGTVTNNTLTITYSVFNLRGDPTNGVLLTTAVQSGVTFQSAVPLPDRNEQQCVFSLVRVPPLGLDAAAAEGASKC